MRARHVHSCISQSSPDNFHSSSLLSVERLFPVSTGAWPDVLAITAVVEIDVAGDNDSGGHGNRDGFAQLYCKGFLSLDHKFHPQGGSLQQLCFVEPEEPTPLLLASRTVVFN